MTVFRDRSGWPTSHLQAVGVAFDALTADPDPLSLDCDHLEADAAAAADPDAGDGGRGLRPNHLGLPGGVVPLPVLRDWLLAHPTRYAARDAVWRELILRARLRGGPWRLAAVGMALPGLLRVAGQLAAGCRGDVCDLDGEILIGFLTALDGRLDLTRPALYASLVMAGFRAGRAWRLTQDIWISVEDIENAATHSRIPHRPYGHPDLLVQRAGMLGLLADEDVQPWIDIRLGGRAIEPYAAGLGVSVDCLRMRLNRADDRLAEALATGALTGHVNPDAARQLVDPATTARSRTVRARRAATGSARPAVPDAAA